MSALSSHERWMLDHVKTSESGGLPISDSVAKAIAALYHSPSPHDAQITRVSHGIMVTDYDELVDQLTRAQAAEDSPEHLRMLGALRTWAMTQVVWR